MCEKLGKKWKHRYCGGEGADEEKKKKTRKAVYDPWLVALDSIRILILCTQKQKKRSRRPACVIQQYHVFLHAILKRKKKSKFINLVWNIIGVYLSLDKQV